MHNKFPAQLVEIDIHNRSIAMSRQLNMYLSCSCKFLRVVCYIAELSNFCHDCLINTQTTNSVKV